jgi:hypothetical protein
MHAGAPGADHVISSGVTQTPCGLDVLLLALSVRKAALGHPTAPDPPSQMALQERSKAAAVAVSPQEDTAPWP